MHKRGISSFVVTLLIILFAVLAVGIIWVFIRPVFIASGGEIGAQSKCFSVNVEPQRCLIENGQVNVRIGVTEGTADGVAIAVNFDDFSRGTAQAIGQIPTFETRTLFVALPANTLAISATASALIAKENGENEICESTFLIACGTKECTSETDCPTGNYCHDGVCTIFQSKGTGGGGGGNTGSGGCSSNSDCAAGNICRNNNCVHQDSSVSCESLGGECRLNGCGPVALPAGNAYCESIHGFDWFCCQPDSTSG